MNWLHREFIVFCCFPVVILTSTKVLRKDDRIPNKAPRTHLDSLLSQPEDVREIQIPKKSNYSVVKLEADATMDECNLTVSDSSKGPFRYKVTHRQLNFVFTHLKFSTDINVSIQDFVVDGLVWTWTYFGDNGGFRFLTHPPEVSVWSLGLLKKSVGGLIDPIELTLETNGCQTNIEIGNETSTLQIGRALEDVLRSLYKKHEDFQANFWCYWRRRWISPDWLYTLCVHVVCPLPHVEYRCCVRHFTPKKMIYELDCSKSNRFVNDFVWYIPFIIGCIFFLNMPLFVFWFAWRISSETKYSLPSTDIIRTADECEDGLQTFGNDVVFLTEENAVTLFKALLAPCFRRIGEHPVSSSRLKRVFFIALTLVCIAIQFAFDSIWTFDGYVSSCVDTGVPIGFRSIRVGYARSTKTFLPMLGGPVIALSLYVVFSFAFIVFPKHLPTLLENGLSRRSHKDDEHSLSPLLLSNDIVQLLSSVRLSSRNSYRRIVDYLQMHMFCILNFRFWTLWFSIQKSRFFRLRHVFLKIILFIPYVILCVMETCICLIFYGLPLLVYLKFTLKAFTMRTFELIGQGISNPPLCFLLRIVSLFVISCAWLIHSFMLCTIFLDAVIFISRIFVYSYEGIVLYPKISYGYIIFIVTVIYYVVKTKNDFGKFYQNILRRSIKVCIKRKAMYIDGSLIVKRQGEYKGVPMELYDAIVERIKPRRVKVFTSLVKILVIVFIASVTTLLMLHLNEFNHIDVLVHVGTTLFICALPKLVEQISNRYNRHANKKLDTEIQKVLNDFVHPDFSESFGANNECCQETMCINSDYSISI